MIVTSDGYFEASSKPATDSDGIPHIRGTLRVPVDGAAQRDLKRAFTAKPGRASHTLVRCRSGHAQVGLELDQIAGDITFETNTIAIPLRIQAVGPVRESWLETLYRLSVGGQR